jgi:hypothetical protein
MDADHWREEADRERQHFHALFEHGIDLSDRLDRLHREWQAELERTRWPWWWRLISRES